jgi:hypothetical protein
VEGSCEHGNETSGSIKCWEVLGRTIGGFSRRAQLHEISINCHCNVCLFDTYMNPVNTRDCDVIEYFKKLDIRL